MTDKQKWFVVVFMAGGVFYFTCYFAYHLDQKLKADARLAPALERIAEVMENGTRKQR